MKTLEDHVLLYDEDCPLCRVYTSGFVKAGMLDAKGRQPYKDLRLLPVEQLDMKRALNEIALVDRHTGAVVYGVESLLKILGHRFSFFKWYGRQKPLVWLARKAYAFVSYNRKVIAPGHQPAGFLHDDSGDGSRIHPTCAERMRVGRTTEVAKDPRSGSGLVALSAQPSLHKGYRSVYIILGSLITGLILFGYANLLEPLLPAADARRELLICVGQIAWQTGVLYGLKSPRKWDYLGNMITVSLIGGIGLLPMLLIAHWIQVPAWLALGYFGIVVGCMFLEHMRRVKLLGLNPVLSWTWIAYRLIVLFFILGFYLILFTICITVLS